MTCGQRLVRRVAVVGTGVIGASWASHFLARGLDVIATDPDPDAEARLRTHVEASWDAVAALGLAPGASRDRLTFTADARSAVAGADFVQESAPEEPEMKVALFKELDDAAPPGVLIASSSSGITMSVIQSGCKHPERTIIGHFFDPLAASWQALASPEVTPELKQAIADGVVAEAAGRSIADLAAARDSMLVGLQRLRAQQGTQAEPEG